MTEFLDHYQIATEDEAWDVELYNGQFVHRAGYYVSTEPCRPEHATELFQY